MRLPIGINEQSAEPLYYQIEVQLRALIISGTLQAGTLLPSIRELASQLKCSVITIKRVYNDLETEGLLRTKQGTGTYVSHVEEQSREEHRLGVVIEAIDHLLEAAKRVQCAKDELEQLLQQKLKDYGE
jgi:GntR family transcriptional regulator